MKSPGCYSAEMYTSSLWQSIYNRYEEANRTTEMFYCDGKNYCIINHEENNRLKPKYKSTFLEIRLFTFFPER